MEQETPSPRVREGALIAVSIVAASLILSWGLSGSDYRYQVAASENAVVRLDTDSGEMIACTSASQDRTEGTERTLRIRNVRFGSTRH
jgi:hypothetical protein